ncbi:MAG TPA: hypothetical protein VJ652_15295 [Noviherbaspirillum sp.]|nr:hypothetical protein [Noviherbaspirillum sp.]
MKNCSDCRHHKHGLCLAEQARRLTTTEVQRRRLGFFPPIVSGTCGERARWFVAKVAA